MKNLDTGVAVSVIFHKFRGMTMSINDNPERALPMCDTVTVSGGKVLPISCAGGWCVMGYSVICTSSYSPLTGCLNPPCISQSTESSVPMTLILLGLRSTYLTSSKKWDQCFLSF